MRESEARIIVFTCNWNAYSSLETAGVEGLSYPAGVCPVKVMCLGRLHPGLILKAFEQGADGVLLLGCPPGECHYGFGNRYAEGAFAEAQALLHLLGIADERLRLDWLDVGDGHSFVKKVTAFIEQLRFLQPSSLPIFQLT